MPWAVSESLIARTRPAQGLVFPKEKGSRLGDCDHAEEVFPRESMRITDEGL